MFAVMIAYIAAIARQNPRAITSAEIRSSPRSQERAESANISGPKRKLLDELKTKESSQLPCLTRPVLFRVNISYLDAFFPHAAENRRLDLSNRSAL